MIRWSVLVLIFPLRLVFAIGLFAFDTVLSRMLIVFPFVLFLWVPLYFIFGLHLDYLVVATAVFGLMLAGLWEGDTICTLHPYFPNWTYFKDPFPLFLVENKSKDRNPAKDKRK